MIAIGLIATITAAACLHVWSYRCYQRRIASAIGALYEPGAGGAGKSADVPAIVRRFAERAQADNRTGPGIVQIRQRGEMRMSPQGRWRSFTAQQYFAVQQPGFVWIANVHAAPMINVCVVDSYIGGAALLEARLMGSIPLAKVTGPELDRGELMRYLAELVWNPGAFSINSTIDFETLDNGAVAACVADVPVQLWFDEHGDIRRVYAHDRPRTVGKTTVPTPWEGRFSDYAEMHGHRIPRRGEAAWLLEEQRFTYWRGEVIEISVDPIA